MISLISPQGALLMNRDQMDAHAVFRKDFTVITNAIAKASSTALEAIFMRQTGLIFTAFQEWEKLRASRPSTPSFAGLCRALM